MTQDILVTSASMQPYPGTCCGFQNQLDHLSWEFLWLPSVNWLVLPDSILFHSVSYKGWITGLLR